MFLSLVSAALRSIYSVKPVALVCGGMLASVAMFKSGHAQQWEGLELPVKLTVGYAVRAVDFNRDGKLDIGIVDSKRVLWLENPSWREHVIYETPDAKADNVCFAPLDVDQDGLIDVALGADWQPNNTTAGGSIGWLHQQPEGKWRYEELHREPTTHRMNWVELVAGQPSLVVAPLKGPASRAPGFEQTGVRMWAIKPSRVTGKSSGSLKAGWELRVLYDQLHVMHNFHVTDLDQDKRPDLLCASYEGVTWLQLDEQGNVRRATRLGIGQEETPPARGSSEIRSGRLGDRHYLATIEPWHGDKVVVYLSPENWRPSDESSTQPWQRLIIDEQLAWGHAVACTNLDADPEEELVIGVRDNQSDTHRCGVRIYDPNADGSKWTRTLVDPGAVAVEDLITADIDGDKHPEIIAVGRATHNAKLYRLTQP